MTHFEVFGLPPQHELDLEALDRRYRQLSLELHPDRVDPRERRRAVEQTATLNEAYKVLKDPVRRAFYLLALAGVDLERDDAAARREMPLEFLEEVMELRERLAEARAAGDLSRAQQMGEQVEALRKEALEAGVSRLEELGDGPKEALLAEAAHQLGRVRYFTRFLEEVAQLEEEALS